MNWGPRKQAGGRVLQLQSPSRCHPGQAQAQGPSPHPLQPHGSGRLPGSPSSGPTPCPYFPAWAALGGPEHRYHPAPGFSVMTAGWGLEPGPEGRQLRSAPLSQDWTSEVAGLCHRDVSFLVRIENNIHLVEVYGASFPDQRPDLRATQALPPKCWQQLTGPSSLP